MRALLLALALAPLATPAWADPRCARFGAPSYSAQRVTVAPPHPPITSRVFITGAQVRSEAPGQMVTLATPTLNALFANQAEPRIAIRMPAPQRPPLPPEALRIREERATGRITLITEIRDEAGQWREIDRAVCRPDGVLLEARQTGWRDGQPQVIEIRQAEIRLGPQDPSLFRLPEGFRLIEPPPRR